MSSIIKNIYAKRAAMAAAMLAVFITAWALPLKKYADNSVLAEGRWVKISVPQSGVYKINKAQLSQWGFSDMSKVHVYGYGGNRIPDRLSAANYTDDLPMVQSETISDGIVFYGVGPEKWVASQGSYYHAEYNIYTNAGYYFVSDRDIDPALMAKEIRTQGIGEAQNPSTSFVERVHHEIDSYSPGEAGYVLVGENFKVQNNREFTFRLPGRVPDSEAWMECTLVNKTYNPTQVSYTVNGEKLTPNNTDNINAISNSVYLHGGYTVSSHSIPQSGEQLKINVSIANISSVINSWLNYISVNYARALALPSQGYLNFWATLPALKLDNGGMTDVRVWDVTDPLNITKLATSTQDGATIWTSDYNGNRTYTAWTPTAAMPAPTYVGQVSNQNLHAIDNVNMVIFTLPEYRAYANRIADLHRTEDEPLSVAVLNVDDVYNEFASGSADISALRKILKMMYDRGNAADSVPSLKYALILGRATYDNRHLTSQFQGHSAYNTIPYWMGGNVKSQFSDNDAYGTDDFIAILGDDSGTNLGLDDLSIAVGRMPVTSPSEAKSAVEKLEKYIFDCKHGNWKNSMVFLADDGDNGTHLNQTEKMIAEIERTPLHQNFISKVYVDAYDIIGGVCEGGRKDMYRMLSEGVVWWNFSGHANNHSWTGEGMFTYSDINNLYLKNVPVLMAATCDFLRWDSNTLSGGEILFHEPNGGTIATISATRPVYISDNGLFSYAVGRSISRRDADGRLPRLGEIYRRAKNNIINDQGEHRSNSNRLRYVLMGDPAMRLATPHNIIHLEAIDGVPVTADNQVTLKALQQAVLTGSVCTPSGEVIEDFNGVLMATIYDAERSTTTQGKRDDNVEITFEQHGDKLFTGNAVVKNGHFELKVAMPNEVTDNFRPASINMYAYTTEGTNQQAVGINSDFYVYGLDESAAPDNNAPVIHSMVLNEESFANGDNVNTSPLVIAEISDDVGINVSAAGIGHQMVLTLDGKRTYTDVSMYYTPAIDGTASGVINYPLENLTPGEHILTLKVWDTASNSASQKISFNVVENLLPNIYRVYTDVNPARTEVKFYIQHNRPEAELTATIEVYDMLGRKLWDAQAKVPSDMHTSYPISWDLCDSAGHRVPRGIYLYRATLSDNGGETYTTATQRLAITAQ